MDRLARAPSAGKYGSGTPGWGPFDCPDPREERSLDPQCQRGPRWDIAADAGPFLQRHSQARSCQWPKLGPLHLLRVVGPETGTRGLSSPGQASALAADSEWLGPSWADTSMMASGCGHFPSVSHVPILKKGTIVQTRDTRSCSSSVSPGSPPLSARPHSGQEAEDKGLVHDSWGAPGLQECSAA